MIWSPSQLAIAQVTPSQPDGSGSVSLTLTGGGYDASVNIFIAHPSTTAADLVVALKDYTDHEGVVIATNVDLGAGGSLTCTAPMKGKKHGRYDVIAAQVVGGELQVAIKKAAFDWR
jgi:hypothetical protein